MPFYYIKLVGLYLIAIIALSTIPTGGFMPTVSEIEVLTLRADYLLHALIFLPWMFLGWLYVSREQITGSKRTRYALAWLLAGLWLAAFAEVIQLFIPYRAFNMLDLYSNLSGVIIGSFIFFFKKTQNIEGI